MVNSNLVFNNSFLLDSTLNQLKELESGEVLRLEPRLVSVLHLLAENVGKLVTRETLINKVWNDYGGADDALNQAISFLRKVLKDNRKEIIETIPKKGYILHATISAEEPIIKKEVRKLDFNRLRIPVAIVIVLLFACFIWNRQTNKFEVGNESPKIKLTKSSNKESVESNFTELSATEEETYFNTITTTGADQVKYKLVAIGDQRPKFYINNQLIAESDQEEYSNLIQSMLRKLWSRKKKYEGSLNISSSK
ncbi:winged helix-turn-helix domain-containing protein [Adhaeribacter aquaticus]|uniref:winged helix-turn-helix domain-containing protein n=1 Tax=Adhaeribacter aquaticus TaxID=299567 RepID=UPI000428147E|nr:winged helix-turn-helix domain-containing protein [Adhaeribacter aquaticus]